MARHPKAQLDKNDHPDFQSPKKMAAAFRRSAALRGFDSCPIADWIEAQPWDGTADGMANIIYDMHHDPVFGPETASAALKTSAIEGYTPPELAVIQMKGIRALVDFPFKTVHLEIDNRLQNPKMKWWSETALRELLAFMRANHPHWVEWAQRPWNISFIPKTYEIAPGVFGQADEWPPYREA